MKRLDDDLVHFLKHQGFIIISTRDKDGGIHNSCKGIVEIDPEGIIHLLDLYKGKTYENMKRNSKVSITAVDEHKFKGYCLKGKAKIIKEDKINPSMIKAWEDKVASRITQRLLKNIHGEKGHHLHAEALLPKPEYLIVMEIEKIIDLTPHHIKKQSKIKEKEE